MKSDPLMQCSPPADSSVSVAERSGHLDLRSTAGESHVEVHITGSASDRSAGIDVAREYFRDVAEVLAERDIQPIQEKVYGQAGAREVILGVRAEEFLCRGLDPSLPVTFVDGGSISGAPFAGLQVWGITPRGPKGATVTTVDCDGTAPARCWAGPGFRMVYLPRVSGMTPGTSPMANPTDQATRMFATANAALKSQGMAYSNVARTWIYLSRLLDWYGEFNRVRTEHHAREGLCQPDGTSFFPASTGIQGKCFDGEECFMDVLALESNGTVDSGPINESARQPDAFSYGSGFSRAMKMTLEGRTILFISGTASINADGESMNIGNPELQAVETLMDIAALLEGLGGSLGNICTSTLFCKDVESYQAYQDVTRLLHLPAFPMVPVLADVCRHELLLEMEAVAVI